jgi:uncharacterized damage-inducible protein DinB
MPAAMGFAMSAKTLLASLFQYKANVDEELLDALDSFSDRGPSEELLSAFRVLNHAHIVDRIFAANLQKKFHGYTASWSREPPAFADLASAIRQTDEWYLNYVLRLTPDELEEVIDFTFTDGGQGRMSREEMLAHVVTHSGYHRGEAGRLLPDIENTAMRDVFAGYLHRAEPQRRGH